MSILSRLANPLRGNPAADEYVRHQAARDEVRHIEEWVRARRDDVDHGAFVEACDRALSLAMYPHRVAHSIFGMGWVTLDVACALIGMPTPNAAYDSRLPGAKRMRDVYVHHDVE